MKNLFIIVLGLLASVCLNTLRANPQTKPPTGSVPKPITITGMISLGEKSFIAESDLKIWTVANPNVLKGHAGHRVSITANVDVAKDKVTVRSIRVLMPLPPQTMTTYSEPRDFFREDFRSG